MIFLKKILATNTIRKCMEISQENLYMHMSCFMVSDAIIQLAVDNTRNILYTRSEKGTIQVPIW